MLPDELLILIFDVLTSSPPPNKFPFSASNPTLLSHVSRVWRIIISTTPSLWTHVPIAPFQSVHTLRSFLRNSSTLPILITVYPWPLDHPYIPFGTLNAQLNTLLGAEPDRERIRGLRIEATLPDDQAEYVIGVWVDPTRNMRFPALSWVSLLGTNRAVWVGSKFFDGLNAPALHTLIVENMPTTMFMAKQHGDAQRVQLNLTTVVLKTSGDVQPVSMLGFSSFVRSFRSLTALVLHGPVSSFRTTPMPQAETHTFRPTFPLPLENIEFLRATNTFSHPSSAVTLFLLLPSLTHAAICDEGMDEPASGTCVMHALRGLAGSPAVLPCLQKIELEIPLARLNSTLRKAISEEAHMWLEGRRVAGISVPTVRVAAV
ncbi:hypothetical protein HYDPIDRAFT_109138 [Hydnomerulius pinastri MD-312]|nr:hypothetical protein HYDPIDRAFT_109138 [Hydnomerulius pinastri MD-312]